MHKPERKSMKTQATSDNGVYVNHCVPFVISCPSCGYPHQTSRDMAGCLIADRPINPSAIIHQSL